MTSKQKTLFQSWGNLGNKPSSQKHASDTRTSLQPSVIDDQVIDLCDEELNEDDALLVQALDESIKTANINGSTYGEHCENLNISNKCPQGSIPFTKVTTPVRSSSSSLFNTYHKTTVGQGKNDSLEEGNLSFGADRIDVRILPTSSVSLSHLPDLPGFDKQAGQLWIYPTNYPVRDYQFNIVQQCLYNNTLVTLPTGLGKTFIAAVVMYNYYRWYPQSKVIFMAPTKPLVAQQIHACYDIMGIPQRDTAEMTGNMNPMERQRTWKEKRVFFLTPQVITNDLSRGTCPADTVKCLVIDEAHKALGNHAYCQVVRELVKYTQQFRIIALSATPGSDIKAVQQVITNLLVSHIELRTEECIDIKPYTHERKVEKIVVALGEELLMIQKKYVQVMSVVVQRLTHQKFLYSQREVTSLSKFLILKAREAFRQNPPPSMPSHQYGVVEGDFALALSLYHGYELLQLHGLRSLYNFLEGIINRDKGYGRTKAELMKNGNFLEIMDLLKTKYTKDDSSWSCSQKQASFVSGHPKMKKLEQVTLEHFNASDHGTRVMIFSQYRDSVQEITDMLNLHRPMVMAMSFIGQSSTGKATKGFTQKEQLKVMKEFREGGYNTLVSTCVGEEGLDIGDVDLIICFDAHKSPIRLVQRMGRTGRKRQGRIVMLVTAGKEEQIYNQSQYSKRSIHKAILNGARSLHLYPNNPRMVPDGLSPACHKMFITVKDAASLNRVTKDPGGAKQRKLLTSKTGTRRKLVPKSEEALITYQEYSELKPFLVSNVKCPPARRPLLSLGSQVSVTTHESEEENTLSLTEWLLWQNRLQETQLVDHSLRSQHLVELVEFLQLQETLPENEDHYGLEMEMYLKLEDVLQPGEKDDSEHDGGILRFSTTSDRGKLPTRREQTGVTVQRRKTVRRSEMLPVIEDWQGEEEDSEGELPEFHTSGMIAQGVDKQLQHVISSISPQHTEAKNDKDKFHKDKMKQDPNILHTKREISLIKPITIDDSDFEEDAPFVVVDMEQEEDSLDCDELNMDLCLGQEEEKVCIARTECVDDIDQVNSTMLRQHGVTDVVPQGSMSRCQLQLGTFIIRPAPPLQEVDMVFSNLRNETELPPLDLKPLICEWYEENYGPAGHVFVSTFEKQHKISVGTNLERDGVCESTALCRNLCETTGDRANLLLSTDQTEGHTLHTQMATAGNSDQSSSDSDVHTFTWMKPVQTRPESDTGKNKLSVLKLNNLKNITTDTENVLLHRSEKEDLETCDKANVDIIDFCVSMNRSSNFRKSLTKDNHNIVSYKPNKLEQETDGIHNRHTAGFANELVSHHSFLEDDIMNDEYPDASTPQTLHHARSPLPETLSFTQALLCVQSSEEHLHDQGQLVLKDLKQEEHQVDQGHLVVEDYRLKGHLKGHQQLVLEDFRQREHVKDNQELVVNDFRQEHLQDQEQPVVDDFRQDHLQDQEQPVVDDFRQEHLQDQEQPVVKDFKQEHLQDQEQPMVENFRQGHLQDQEQPVVDDFRHGHLQDQEQPVVDDFRQEYLQDQEQPVVEDFRQEYLQDQEQPVVDDFRQEHLQDQEQPVVEDFRQGHLQDQEQPVVEDFRQEHLQDQEQPVVDDFRQEYLQDQEQPVVDDFRQEHLQDQEQPVVEDFRQGNLQDQEQPVVEDFRQEHLQDQEQPVVEDFRQGHLQDQEQPVVEDFRQEHLQDQEQPVVKDLTQDTDDIGHFMPSFNLFNNDSDFDDGCHDEQQSNICSSSSDIVKHSFSEIKVTQSKSTSIKSAPKVMSSDQQQHSEVTDLTEACQPHINNDGDDFDLPQFDLEFDSDDDIIPPSPTAAQTFSQMSSSRSQVNVSSRKKINFKENNGFVSEERDETTMQCGIARKTSNEVQHMSWDNPLDDDIGTTNLPHSPGPAAQTEGKVMNKTTASKADGMSPSVVFVKADQGDTLNSMPTTPFLNSPLSSHVRSSTPKVGMSKIASCISHLAQIATPVMNTVSSRIATVSSGVLASPCPALAQTSHLSNSPSTSTHSSPHEGCGTEEESFHVVRKRKVAAILDDTENSFSLQHKQESEGENVPSFKTPSRPAARKKQKMKLDFSSDEETESGTSFAKSWSRTSRDHHSSSHINDGDDDFQLDKGTGRNRIVNASNIKKKKKKRETIKRGGGHGFLDNEAMLSGSDASSDEEWDSNDEYLEASFVNDDTQMSQDQVDIHAVYLKSVRSPIQRNQFRLQTHHYEMDVFSQVPEHEDNEYEEDSFCVGDDFQESEYIEEEEHDLLDDFEEFSHNPKRKSAKRSKSPNSKHIVGGSRKRIRQISGSSSEEETRVATSVHESTQADNHDSHLLCSQKTKPIRKRIAAILSSSEEEISPKSVSKSSHHAPHKTSFEQSDTNTSSQQRPVAVLDTDKMRQERLAKQKQKQEEFRTRMSKKNGAASNFSSYEDRLMPRTAGAPISGSTVNMSRRSLDSSQNTENRSKFDCEDYDFASDKLSSVIPKPLPTDSLKDKIVILVDSREISGAQDIVSNLRLQHGVRVLAGQLGACDYIISNRTAVDRRQLSDFSNGAQRVKLIDRVQQMRDLYDRCCLIVEKDRVKPGEEKSAKLSHRTKYYDWIRSVIVQTNVRLFFTENQGETAALMAQLAHLEKKKQLNISVPVDVGHTEEQVLKFYTSIPKVSYVNALNLCYNYRSISHFLSSYTPQTVSVRGRMSEVRAADVCCYVAHTFDLQMLPTNR